MNSPQHFYILTIVIIGLMFIGYILYDKYYPVKEKFGDKLSIRQTHEILDPKKQFTDMIVYDNDPSGRIGLDKCIENCNGYCVEFGQTGAAYCYPAREPESRDFTGDIVPNEKQLSYPNLRE
jgi:hypothetical protein